MPLTADPTPPGPITNVEVNNMPGRVELRYTLPSSENLLYVRANYTLESGREMEVKASYYNNSMVLEGFRGGEQAVPVQVSTVNRSEVASEPIEVMVSPAPAPIFDVKESLSLTPDFGGLRVQAENPTGTDVAILIMIRDDAGDWEPIPNSIYTSQDTVNQAIRGYDTTALDLAIVVRDRWLNNTDTLFQTIQPLFETLIPTSGYRPIKLANDPPPFSYHQIEDLWDGLLTWPDVYLTLRDNPAENHTVTMDMGTVAKLSRVKMWQFPEPIGGIQTYYYLGVMKHFKIWGRTDQPDPSGSWDGWIELGEYIVEKPSGLPYGQQSNEDVLKGQSGEDFQIPLDAPPVRFIRIQNLENWAGRESLAISEMLLYGDPNQ